MQGQGLLGGDTTVVEFPLIILVVDLIVFKNVVSNPSSGHLSKRNEKDVI